VLRWCCLECPFIRGKKQLGGKTNVKAIEESFDQKDVNSELALSPDKRVFVKLTQRLRAYASEDLQGRGCSTKNVAGKTALNRELDISTGEIARSQITGIGNSVIKARSRGGGRKR